MSSNRNAQLINPPSAFSTTNALLRASINRSSHSATSSTATSLRPLTLARILLGVSNCNAYRRDTFVPCWANFSNAGSDIKRPSVLARRRMMVCTSDALYGCVGIMSRRARRSGGTPCAPVMSCVPLMTVLPRLEARMTMGEIGDSRARLRYVKHSMSSMWT